MAKDQVISNKVFIGCPWKNIKVKYEKSIKEIHKHYPLYCHIVGREEHYQAEDLLKRIEDEIRSSSHAIFDATGGNANVSLEFGFSEGIGIDRAIFISTHRASSGKGPEKPVISDLVGKSRIQYTNESSLRNKIKLFSRKHPFTVKFEKWIKSLPKGERTLYRSSGIKIIRLLDNKKEIRRQDAVAHLEAIKDKAFAENIIKGLKDSGLIGVSVGGHSTVSIA